MLTIHPEMAVGMLTTSNNMRYFFDAIMDGVASAQFEFLNIKSLIFPKRVVVEVVFFIVNGLYMIKICFGIFSFGQVETLSHTGFYESRMFV